MLLPKIFAITLAVAVLGTSVMIAVMGGKFQNVEKAAYSSKGRPWWFYLASAVYAIFYIATLISFAMSPDKTWAGWVLVVFIPVAAVLKGVLIIFNKEGQKKVTSIEGDQAWRKVALSRLILLPLLIALAYYA